MKNVWATTFVVTGLLFFNACEKCYRCHNLCSQCSEQHNDTTLTITVCSDVFGEDYYLEYLDSLTSPNLGWTCTEHNSNRTERFCGTTSGNNVQLLNKKEEGFICSPE